MRESYMVNEMFYSVQGEGLRQGTANVFIRLSGCNLECKVDGEAGFDCDTEFVSGVKMTAKEIVAKARELMGEAVYSRAIDYDHSRPWVILTGGEPSLQVDEALIDALHAARFLIAIETNGTKELPESIDWVSCSPKSAEHTLRIKHADELRYVRHAGQGVPRPTIDHAHVLISPAFESLVAPNGGVTHRPHPGALAHCIEMVKQNPSLHLSVQQHKLWMVR